jgi:hypothetical protein
MSTIIDVSSPCTRKAAALRTAGVATVIRYYSRDTIRTSKRLSREEAQALAQAGLRIGVVHEGRHGDKPDNFEHASGIADARHARTYGAAMIGQPAGSTIYFAVDFDASQAQIRNLIVPYFRGVADAFAEATGESGYVVGVYGSGAVCAALLDAALVRKTWLSQSRGWSGHARFLASGRWDLQQALPQSVAGIECDPNTANDGHDIGDFVLGQPVVAPTATRTVPGTTMASTVSVPLRVNARSGLRLRTGPGTDFDFERILPLGTLVHPIKKVDAWMQVDLQGDGVADGFVSSAYLVEAAAPGAAAYARRSADAVHVPELIRQGSTAAGLKAARTTAKAALAGYPTNGCAVHLSALLQQAGIDVAMIFGAGKLGQVLADRGWARIGVGSQQPGDVGVCYDNDPTPAGADHIYLVVGTHGADEMTVADNQRSTDAPHARYASGRGKTPTEYFLRAS